MSMYNSEHVNEFDQLQLTNKKRMDYIIRLILDNVKNINSKRISSDDLLLYLKIETDTEVFSEIRESQQWEDYLKYLIDGYEKRGGDDMWYNWTLDDNEFEVVFDGLSSFFQDINCYCINFFKFRCDITVHWLSNCRFST